MRVWWTDAAMVKSLENAIAVTEQGSSVLIFRVGKPAMSCILGLSGHDISVNICAHF
jgi:hypothetical protein